MGFDEGKISRDDKGRFSSEGGGAGEGKSESKSSGGRTWTESIPAGILPAGMTETWQAHFDKDPRAGGKPTPERAALHAQIIADATSHVSTPAPGEQKLAIFTMGGPASGKSSMLRGVDTTKFVKVDPDGIKDQLPEYGKATAHDASYRKASVMAHEESSFVARKVTEAAIDQGKHVIVDGTGASAASMVSKIRELQGAGYHIHVAYSHLDEKTAMDRMKVRAEQTGRYVPEEFVHAAYQAIPNNFEKIRQASDSFEMFDSGRSPSVRVWSGDSRGSQTRHDESFVRQFQSDHPSKK